MKKSLIALLLVVALVVTVSVFAVSAADTDPFEGATGTVTADCPYCGADQTWYPIDTAWANSSMQNWEHWDNGGHYYYTQDMTDGSGDTFTTETVCINLNGKTVTRATNAIWFTINGADEATKPVLTIIDTSVDGSGVMTQPSTGTAGFFTLNGTGTVNVYGGTIYATTVGSASGSSGVAIASTKNDVDSTATFNLYGGTIYGESKYSNGLVSLLAPITVNVDGGHLNGRCGGGTGGVIGVNNADAKLYLKNGSITGGLFSTAAGWGTSIKLLNGYFEMSGGTLTGESNAGGTTARYFGGSLYAAGSTNALISGGTITGGAVKDTNGGNIYWDSTGTLTMTGGTIEKGTATRVTSKNYQGSGGNVYINKGTFNMSGGTISGGLDTVQSAHCGNLYLAANAVGNITGGTITGGRTTNYGGNIYCSGGKLTIDADEGKTVKITNGVASAGGNIYIRNDNGNAATITGPDVTISGGDDGTKIAASSATAQVGSQIMVYSSDATKPCVLNIKDVAIDSSDVHTTELALFNNAQLNVFGEKTIDTVYIVNADSCKVTVQEGYTGNLFVRWREAACTNNVVNGGTLDASLTAVAAYANSGVVKGVDGSRSAKTAGWDGTNFVIATYGGFKADAEGNVTETPLVEMPSEAGKYDFIRPYFTDPITLKADTTLDVNNSILTVNTNGFKLSLIETRSNDFSDKKAQDSDDDMTGYVVVDEPANLMPTTKESAYGNQYITLPFGQGYTARRVSVDIDSVSIKPKNVDLYYTTNMDTSLLASQYAVSYGVVLSLVDMPGENFVSDDSNNDDIIDNLYTETDFNLGADERVHIVGTNSALLEGILTKDAATNQAYGEMPIYATAFVCFNFGGDDIYVMADKTYTLSLKQILMELDKTNAATSEVAVDMYKNWQNPMAAWANDLPNMAAAAAEQA